MYKIYNIKNSMYYNNHYPIVYRIINGIPKNRNTFSNIPFKHAVMCQHWASNGPMLGASAPYWSSSGMFTGYMARTL